MTDRNPLDTLPSGLRQRLIAAQYEYLRAQKRLAEIHDQVWKKLKETGEVPT